MKKPAVQIFGASGRDLFPAWSEAGLISVAYSDADGSEADQIDFSFAVSAPFPAPPAEGEEYRFHYGWEGEPLRYAGRFTYQSDTLSGDAESGYTLTITARSSDFIDADKADDTEHFENTTAGEIFRKLAGQSGKSAKIDPEIAATPIPYRLRYAQSLTGFATELAEELGGTLKLADSNFLVSKRNAGTTPSGTVLPTIEVAYEAAVSIDLASDGKTRFKDTEKSWFDPDAGIVKAVKGTSSGRASRYLSLHPARSEGEATAETRSEGAEFSRASISGTVEVEGDTRATAGAPVKLTGFGAYDGRDLIAANIGHTFTFDDSGGWLMSIECAARAKE